MALNFKSDHYHLLRGTHRQGSSGCGLVGVMTEDIKDVLVFFSSNQRENSSIQVFGFLENYLRDRRSQEYCSSITFIYVLQNY